VIFLFVADHISLRQKSGVTEKNPTHDTPLNALKSFQLRNRFTEFDYLHRPSTRPVELLQKPGVDEVFWVGGFCGYRKEFFREILKEVRVKGNRIAQSTVLRVTLPFSTRIEVFQVTEAFPPLPTNEVTYVWSHSTSRTAL
jgi:hypothetical protein